MKASALFRGSAPKLGCVHHPTHPRQLGGILAWLVDKLASLAARRIVVDCAVSLISERAHGLSFFSRFAIAVLTSGKYETSRPIGSSTVERKGASSSRVVLESMSSTARLYDVAAIAASELSP